MPPEAGRVEEMRQFIAQEYMPDGQWWYHQAIADLLKAYDAAQAEAQRLREALKRIHALVVTAEGCPVGHGVCQCSSSEDCIIGGALAALAPAPEPTP